jgi:hypothetical protein
MTPVTKAITTLRSLGTTATTRNVPARWLGRPAEGKQIPYICGLIKFFSLSSSARS